MKRKKQLLAWVLSFLMVFSIMPMISISAFAAEYDANVSTIGKNVYPGDVIKGSSDGMTIMYFNNQDDCNYLHYTKDSSIVGSEAVTGYTIVSSGAANLAVSDGYVLDSYKVVNIHVSGGNKTEVYLIANWKEIKKITYDMTNISVSSDINVTNGQITSYVTTSSAVSITIAADTGYKLPDTIAVEMGGVVIGNPDYDYNTTTGIIKINNITGDVKITAAGVLSGNIPTPPVETFETKKNTSSGSSSSSSSKSDILIVEPTEEAIINALKTADYKKIQINVDSNPNLLLSKAIIDALTVNKDKTLIIVSNNVSTNITVNANNEMQFDRNGNLLAGFASVCNAEYYAEYNGIVKKGWALFPGDTWYYLDKETGIKGKGWINDGGNWYYLNTMGVMQRGWINSDGKWYFLYANGSMAHDTYVDGYCVGNSGDWIS